MSVRVRALVAGAVAVALLPACGLGDKQAMADRVVDAVEALTEEGTATGTVGVTATFVRFPESMTALAEQRGIDLETPPPTNEVVLDVALDLDAARARLGAADDPLEIFDDLEVYGIRQAAAEDDARPWAFVDLGDLDEGEAEVDPDQDAAILAIGAINPAVLVDLAAGALTGSIEDAGTESVAGVETTRYDANFDLEKTTEDTRDDRYDDDKRETLDALFDLLTVRGTVHAGSVWVDGDGVLRQVVLRFETEPELDTIVEVALRLTIDEVGVPLAIEPPGPRDWLEVSTMVGFLRTIIPESMITEAFGSQLPMLPAAGETGDGQ